MMQQLCIDQSLEINRIDKCFAGLTTFNGDILHALLFLREGSLNYDPRAACGLRGPLIRPAETLLSTEKITEI